jgi:hypothetical protein
MISVITTGQDYELRMQVAKPFPVLAKQIPEADSRADALPGLAADLTILSIGRFQT